MPHPKSDHFSRLEQPGRSAAELGYRMPAEWEPQSAVWVTRPHNVETWPVVMERALEQFDAWIDQLRRHVPVCVTQSLNIPTNDSWIRDYGPIFVVKDRPATSGSATPLLAMHDFHFNAWGAKYELRELDDLLPQHVAHQLNLPIWVHDLVLEGGSIEVNGRGTLLTTEQCLLNPNRNPALSRRQIEAALSAALNTPNIIWLPGGIEGDDTDGHIDDIARFVNPTTIAAIRAPKNHPDHDMLERNWQALQAARDEQGGRFTLIPLPVPDPITFNYPPDRFGPGGESPLPASYANFLITNEAVFVPVFGQPNDEPALKALEQACPEHAIIPVRSEWLVVGLGALHCLSQQQPAVPVA